MHVLIVFWHWVAESNDEVLDSSAVRQQSDGHVCELDMLKGRQREQY